MKILLTGSRGFIGKNIFNILINKYEIIGIDILKNNDTIFNIDITDYVNLEDFIHNNKDIDIIIHSAALAHNKGTDLSFNCFKKINFEGTKNLIDLSNKYLKLKRFIFFSTISVYGEDLKKNIYHEESPYRGKTPYAKSKIMSEEYLIKNAIFSYTILRLSPVYSKNFTLNIDRRTRIKGFIYKVGNGTNKVSLLNVKNIIEFMGYLITHETNCLNEVYNLADNQIYTYNDLIHTQINISGINKTLYIPRIIFFCTYLIGRIMGNNFLVENSIKIITDNVYDTSKISSIITFKYNLFNAF